MSESPTAPTKTFIALFVVALAAAFVFAALWLGERGRKPSEVIKEVAKPVEVITEVLVEKIKEVPKEVIKQVEIIKEVEAPAKLTAAQEVAIDFAARFQSAPVLTDIGDALYKLDSVSVQVQLNDAVKKVVSADRVKNKFELILRKQNIRLDDK